MQVQQTNWVPQPMCMYQRIAICTPAFGIHLQQALVNGALADLGESKHAGPAAGTPL